ncbi:uncharacterized protein DNG_06936 [Cephalotrichum gorgonifer]|uniref:DUF7735 domain-containing protein n=1 Tax=Cephalotrichum gorgonifer TaxID=2041049 RepID=A0AAE8N3D4_9PEZI|nr:uncharacterized protein DNG_06936 [Cephalotrichum gorgonifer]
MLTKSILVSSFAAVALANAAANANPGPAPTPAPVRRQFGDIGDEIDDVLGGAGTNLDNIISKASTFAAGVGDDVGGLVSKASTLATGLGGDAAALTKCLSAAAKLTDVPTPNEELIKVVATLTADFCSPGTAIPSSLSSEWNEYTSEVKDWYAKNSDAVSAVISDCPTQTNFDFSQVTGCLAGDAGSNSNGGSGNGSGNSGDDGSAATRVTGALAAAAAALVGAAAILL